MSSKLMGWKELPPCDQLAAKTAEAFETGDWRLGEKPVWHPEICIQCLICWISCPDSAVTVENSKMTGFDLKHCKGCGICAYECPTKPNKAITMESEK